MAGQFSGWVRMIENTLSDGSKTWDVLLPDGETELACIDENAAWNLANMIDKCMVGAQFDGWADPIRRSY